MAKKANKRVSSKRRARPKGRGSRRGRRAPVDPMERKARNRTFLLLGLLLAVNAYVFFGGDASLSELGLRRAAAITKRSGGALGSFADPPATACHGGAPRIFDGLHELLHGETSVSGASDLSTTLRRLGIDAASIAGAVAAIQPVFDLGLLAGSDTPLRTASDRFGTLQAIEIELGEGRLLQACRAADGYEARVLQHPPSADVVVVDLELGRDTDLLEAIASAGESPELAAVIAEALAYDLDLLVDARPHDRLKVILEKRFLGRAFHRYGPILGIRFTGEAGTFTYLRHQPEGGTSALYTPDGEPQRRTLRRSPVAFHRVATDARGLLTPTLEVITGRAGAMFRRPEGAPIVALGAGHVRAIGEAGDLGQTVEIELEDQRILRYAHLMRVIGDLRPGTPIRAGQLIGLAGHTGKTASDRVRLELWEEHDGVVTELDPLLFRASGEDRPPRLGEALGGESLDRFREDTVSLRRLLR